MHRNALQESLHSDNVIKKVYVAKTKTLTYHTSAITALSPQ